ncbi:MULTISPECIES: MupA/Atu3671 family FMN-dependent luciferase-like monooxygenase [Myxococcus]|uniref:LLM class flavin-dependent oxidoreductase n=1 Tax=Myxococcus llanfairpwllgwyngyllgogerychwyrndrobwllllantysiliogogogochensis TaxID=2590453 RepID=A0A540X349_9BACT|nr:MULTISPECIES: MupA/Atu3671 family FMN-dependent luciferase-like monooxygenase [Myxococcus]NTX02055.1 LLM class flavin-dependent oxidoreductase [Myxococcus sp. CA040A]TQF15114.1 LLM class flavin-dependent oxidoreductase [Myxococcus llanfairpwllgwyngyllgogerychwyrndrobwllllantysiliogogogochensis]
MDSVTVKSRLDALSTEKRELFQRRLREHHRRLAGTPEAPPVEEPARLAARVDVTRSLQFSLFFFSSSAASDDPRKYELLLRCVELAEAEGLHAIWTPERHFVDFGSLFPNPAVLGAALAARTSRIGIRAGSVAVPLHDPLRVVEEWSVVDNLSGGRVGISLASGWHPDDFVLAPDAFAERHRHTAEAVALLRSAWRGEPVRRANGLQQMVEVTPRPRPLQRELPLWLTVVRSGGFAHASRLGLNVLTGLMDLDVEELGRCVSEYRRDFSGEGPPRVTLTVHTHVRPEPGRARAAAHGPLRSYLRSFIHTSRNSLMAQPEARAAVEGLTALDEEAIMSRITDRYLESRSLIGTPEECAGFVDRLSLAGVDEVACLVDFGMPGDEVFEGLTHLLRVRDEAERRREASP